MNNKILPSHILYYAIVKGETNNNSDSSLTNESIYTTTTDNMCVSQENHCTSQALQSIEPSIISYVAN